MKNPCKFAKCCLEKLDNGDFEDGVAKEKFYSAGGRKIYDVEAREALLQKFVEMRSSLRAQLLRNLSLLQTKKNYVH